MKKVKAIDFEGDWYLIPNEEFNDFNVLTEKFYNGSSDEYIEEIAEEIEDKYSKYKTGGDLNIIQLYVDGK